jgi:8-amino-7-oxononanoate synthase
MNWNEELAAISPAMRRGLRNCSTASLPEVELDGRRVLQFASNNYLGLSTHPRVVAAMQKAAADWGAGSGASPLVLGHQGIHAELETALAASKGAEAALVFAAGSLANLGCLSALAGPGDQVFLDKLDHATLYDGARLSSAAIARFPHQDLERLAALLKQAREAGSHRIIIAVDGVYSMDGDVAPLPALIALAQEFDAVLVVDEAHSTGVLGPKGHGLLEYYHIEAWPACLVLTGTLSKALGTLGGYVAGPRALIDLLVNKSRSYIFATALPGPCAAAALEALRVIGEEPALLESLRRNTAGLRTALATWGWLKGESATPIMPIGIGPLEKVLALQQKLWDGGIYAPAIRPPTVAAGACRLRLSVTAQHSSAQIEQLVKVLGYG